MAQSLAGLEQGTASLLETGTGHFPPQPSPSLVLHAPTSNNSLQTAGQGAEHCCASTASTQALNTPEERPKTALAHTGQEGSSYVTP